jgi:3',5'-cyclic AMP phosphodiesterase CpdA
VKRTTIDLNRSKAGSMFTLAHLSDPHVPTRLAPGIAALMNKRLLGYLSWRYRRSLIHRREILDALGRDLDGQRPDHVAVTGDLVNISLPEEFINAADWLNGLGRTERVTVVPGNHDAYVAVPWAQSWALWADYMASETPEGTAVPPATSADFPILRRRGPVAIVGLSTALPTAPGLATGKLGEGQLADLADHLQTLDREDLFRVVLLHHPPIPGTTTRRKGLIDAAAFRQAVAATGAELVLYGHNHRFASGEIPGRDGPVPVFGVPSASALPSHGKPVAQYHLFDIDRTRSSWTVTLRIRRYDPQSEAFCAAETRTFDVFR